MHTRTIAAVAVAAAIAVPSAASGRATPQPFHDVQTTIDTGVDSYGCFVGIVGNGMTTDVIDGHFTPNDNGFHFAGVIHREYTLAFGDGTHVLGHVVQHISFNATRSGVTIDTEPSQEEATIYSADGGVLGTIHAFELFHATYVDANGNGEPDPGEFTVAFDRVRVTCP
jgi:hypothetical protein